MLAIVPHLHSQNLACHSERQDNQWIVTPSIQGLQTKFNPWTGRSWESRGCQFGPYGHLKSTMSLSGWQRRKEQTRRLAPTCSQQSTDCSDVLSDAAQSLHNASNVRNQNE